MGAWPEYTTETCARFSKLRRGRILCNNNRTKTIRLPRYSNAKMKVEEIAEAVAKLSPEQLARFRRWFGAFEAGRNDHA